MSRVAIPSLALLLLLLPVVSAQEQLSAPVRGYTFQGTNLRWFGLTIADDSQAHATCRAECAKDPRCRGYALVLKGAFHPNDFPVCYLMAKIEKTVPSSCCITASKQAAARNQTTAAASAQAQYLHAYGPPTLFVLTLSPIQQTTDIARVRRIETWIYVRQGLRALFDNGYFVKEDHFDSSAFVTALPPTSLKPSDFVAGMTRDQVRTRYGPPDSVSYGGHRFEVDRYLAPARGVKSFVFMDNRLLGVTAGFALTSSPAVSPPPPRAGSGSRPQPASPTPRPPANRLYGCGADDSIVFIVGSVRAVAAKCAAIHLPSGGSGDYSHMQHVPFGTPLTVSAILSGQLPPGWIMTVSRQLPGSGPVCQVSSGNRCDATVTHPAPPDTRYGIPEGFRVQIYAPNGNSAGYSEITLLWCDRGRPLQMENYQGQCG